MTRYLLPCECGATTPVAPSQAGQTVRCQCGKQLEVPTLRGLQGLEMQTSQGAPAARPWEERQKAIFVLAAGSLVALALAGYLLLRLPRPLLVPITGETQSLEEASPEQIHRMLTELAKGIDYIPPEINAANKASAERRQVMLWAATIAGAGGLLGLGAVAMLSMSAQRHARQPTES